MASLATMPVCPESADPLQPQKEWEGADDDLFREMTEGAYPTQKNGLVQLPDAAGLGIQVNFAEFKKNARIG